MASFTGEEDFESYTSGDDLNGGSGGSGFSANWVATASAVKIQTSEVHEGTNAVSLITSSGEKEARRDITAAADGSVYVAFKRSSVGGADSAVAIMSGSTHIGYISLNRDGNVKQYYTASWTTNNFDTYGVTVWHALNIEWDDSAQPDKYRARVHDGTSWGTFSAWNTTLAAYSTIDRIRASTNRVSGTQTLWIDAVSASDPMAGGGSSASSSPSPSASSSPSPSASSSPSPSASSSPSPSESASPSSSPSPSPSPGTSWTLLADAKANGLVSATTAGIDTTGADLLIIGVACADNWDGTPTDSKSNTWTEVSQTYTNSEPRVRLFYSVPSTVGTAHTVTADEDGALDDLVGTVFFAAFSHAYETGFTEDQINGANAAGAATLATGSITPSEDGTLIIAGYAVNGTGATPISIDTGFTEIDEQDFVSATSYGGALAYFDQGTAAAINPTWTRSNTNGQAAIIVSFKLSAGSSASSSPSPSVSSSPSPSVSSSPSPSVSSSPSPSPSPSVSSSPSPSVSSSPSPSVSSSPSPSVSSSPSPSVSSSPSPSVSSSPSTSPSPSVSSSPSPSVSSSPSPSESSSPSSSVSSSVSSSPSTSPSTSPSGSDSPSTSPSPSVSSSVSSSPSPSPSPFIWTPITRNSY